MTALALVIEVLLAGPALAQATTPTAQVPQGTVILDSDNSVVCSLSVQRPASTCKPRAAWSVEIG